MDEGLKLTEAERDLMIELLLREMEDLPVEIHHSQSSDLREALRHRRDLVRHLLERLQPAATVAQMV